MALLERTGLTASYYTLTGAGLGERPRHTLSERAAAAAAAGFDSLALSPDELATVKAGGGDAAALVATISAHGLAVTELEPLRGWDDPGASPSDPGEQELAIYELADAFGARQVNVIQVVGDDVTSAGIVERFAGLCERAARHGLTVAFEPRASSPVERPAQAAALIEAAGAANAGIVLDAYHFHRAGLTLAELSLFAVSLVASVQLNDMHATPVGDPPEDALQHRLVPGAGDIDLAGWLRGLNGLGVDVPLAVEAMSRELDELPLQEAAERAFAGAQAALAAARAR